MNKDDYKQNLVDKLAGKPGLRGRIDAHCIDCVYDPCQGGTWRKQVENCTCKTCQFHPVRATQTKEKRPH
jgi:hypothetical protein